MNRVKTFRENRDLVVDELEAAGVRHYEFQTSSRGHTIVVFYRGGNRCQVGLAPSGDWRARKNNMAALHRALRHE